MSDVQITFGASQLPDISTSPAASQIRSLIILSVVTCVYLVLEVAYNASVVRVLSSVSADKPTIEGMETIGKVMASIGITLFLSRLIGLRRALSFVGVAGFLYLTISAAVSYYLDTLPAQARIDGHWLGIYRLGVIHGEIAAPDMLNARRGAPGAGPAQSSLPNSPLTTAQRLALANVALLTFHDQPSVTADAQRYLKGSVATAAARFDARTIDRMLDRFWPVYARASAQLKPGYAIAQRFFGRMTPQTYITRLKGGQYITPGTSAASRLREYCSILLYAGDPNNGLGPVSACDLPPFFSRAALCNEIEHRIGAAKSQVVNYYWPSADGPVSAVSHDLSSTAFVPPISMTLSLLSLTFSLASLAGYAALFIVYVCWPSVSARARASLQFGVTMVVAAAIATCMNGGSPFPESNRFHQGEMAARDHGIATRVWAFALDRELAVLQRVESVPQLVQLADSLPAAGHWVSWDHWKDHFTKR
ncbi:MULTISPECIES: hypothetical protein [unclassified Burkholderia]|uniref:hypothetical protein n=1 Tax=unclassified Burkholderia TaxID=2613784 RepID=UPI002AB0F1FC|nr:MULTISPECIES: hypothetical protein [unclassified Burkholderia]